MAEEEELLDFDDDLGGEEEQNMTTEDPEDAVVDGKSAKIDGDVGGSEGEEPLVNGSEKFQDEVNVSSPKEALMKDEIKGNAQAKKSSGDEGADLEDGELADLPAEVDRKAEEGGDSVPRTTTDAAAESPRGAGGSRKRDSQRDVKPERSGHQSSDRSSLKRSEAAGDGPHKRPRPWQGDPLRGASAGLGSRGLGLKGMSGGHSLLDHRRAEMMPGMFGGGGRPPMDLMHMALYGAGGHPHFGAGFPGGQQQLDFLYQMSVLQGQHLAQDLLARQPLIHPSSRAGLGRPRSSPPPSSRSAPRSPPDRHVSRNPPRLDPMLSGLSNGSLHGPGGLRQRRSSESMAYPDASSRAGWGAGDVGMRGRTGGGGGGGGGSLMDQVRGPPAPPPGGYRQPYMVSQWWDPGPAQPALARGGERRDSHVAGHVGSRRRSEREPGRGPPSPPRVSSRRAEGERERERGGGRHQGREDGGSRRREEVGHERDRRRPREEEGGRRERRPTGFDVGPPTSDRNAGGGASRGLAASEEKLPPPPPPPRSPSQQRQSKTDVAVEKLPPPPPLPPGGLSGVQRVRGEGTRRSGPGAGGLSDAPHRPGSAEKLSPQAVVQVGNRAKTRTLSVTGLPSDFSISSVVTAFEQQGQVVEFSRRDAHFYITYDTVNEAVAAQRSFHRSSIGGHQITVGYA